MREPARHFRPGGCALRVDELCDVVEHHHKAAAGRFGQRHAARMYAFAAALQLELELPGLRPLLAQVRAHQLGKFVELLANDGGRSAVADGKRQVLPEHEHAG